MYIDNLVYKAWDKQNSPESNELWNLENKTIWYNHLIVLFLTHFIPMLHFYTPWKRQKTKGFIGHLNKRVYHVDKNNHNWKWYSIKNTWKILLKFIKNSFKQGFMLVLPLTPRPSQWYSR